MSVLKIGNSWWVDIGYHRKRYRVRSPLSTKTGAREHEAFLRGELTKHGHLDHLDAQNVAAPCPRLRDLADRWMTEYVENNLKRSGVAAKRFILKLHIIPFLGGRQLDEISSADVERLKSALRAKALCPKSVNNVLTVLKTLLDYAVEEKLVDRVPRIRFAETVPPRFRYLTTSECDALLTTPDEFWRLMVMTGLRTGLRFGELAALEWRDVDLAAGNLCVRQSFVRGHIDTPKNGRIRYVPLASDLAEMLVGESRTQRFVFGEGAQPLGYERSRRALRRVCKNAGVGPCGWHVLRHTFASHLVQRGAHIVAVKELMGHASIETTMRYAHLAPKNHQDCVALLSDAAGRPTAAGRQSGSGRKRRPARRPASRRSTKRKSRRRAADPSGGVGGN